MKAKVKTAFSGCLDGELVPRTIEVGEIIEGDLAAVAVREKWATKVGAARPRARAGGKSKVDPVKGKQSGDGAGSGGSESGKASDDTGGGE